MQTKQDNNSEQNAKPNFYVSMKSFCSRPCNLWWLGITLFLPSMLLWTLLLLTILKHIVCGYPYALNFSTLILPLIAALLGLFIPIFVLVFKSNISWRKSITYFTCYICLLSVWGVIDIRNGNYQMSSLDITEGEWHRRYYYYSWYWIPQRLINTP